MKKDRKTLEFTSEFFSEHIKDVSLQEGIRKKGLAKYIPIMQAVQNDKIMLSSPESAKVRQAFCTFYRINPWRDDVFKEEFFSLFDQLRMNKANGGEIITVEKLAEILFEKIKGRGSSANFEVSFCSKMIASIYPDEPIYDSKVIHRIFGAKPITKEDKLAYFNRLKEWYNNIDRTVIKEYSALFDEIFKDDLDGFIVSNTKKIDFLLWSM
jgi:hypothetical protein